MYDMQHFSSPLSKIHPPPIYSHFFDRILFRFIWGHVVQKTQCGKCLQRITQMYMNHINRKLILLYCVVMHPQDVLFLQNQSRCHQDSTRWASSLNHTNIYAIDEKRYNLTVLYFNALAKSCTTLSPIPVLRRFSVVSVFIKSYRYVWDT